MAVPEALIADRYRLIRQLGAGGMGVVWEAHDERLDRPVAVKQLRPQPALTDAEADVVARRAMREARINARLQHPYAVSVFDVV
ncbi:MAG: serine/threonine protein kinase, partial [Microlunatus sp.]|nr:serine/threonine protein kinase [Microlunatus sp.]